MRRGSIIAAIATVAVAGAFSSGCPHHFDVDASYPPGPLLYEPPPPPLAEEAPLEWPDGQVWVTGYWHWSGARYLWVRGRFVAPPAAGLYWYPGGYVRWGRGYAYARGGWVGRGFRPYHRYVYGSPRWYRRYYAYPYRARGHAYPYSGGRRYAPAPELYEGRRYRPAPELGGSSAQPRRRAYSAPGRGRIPRAAPGPAPSRRRAPPSR